MVGIHVTATASVGRMEVRRRETGQSSAIDARKGTRDVDYAPDGTFRATIYDGERLRPGMKLSGPAIVEEPASTIVIHDGNDAEIDGFGNVVIRINSRGTSK